MFVLPRLPLKPITRFVPAPALRPRLRRTHGRQLLRRHQEHLLQGARTRGGPTRVRHVACGGTWHGGTLRGNRHVYRHQEHLLLGRGRVGAGTHVPRDTCRGDGCAA